MREIFFEGEYFGRGFGGGGGGGGGEWGGGYFLNFKTIGGIYCQKILEIYSQTDKQSLAKTYWPSGNSNTAYVPLILY